LALLEKKQVDEGFQHAIKRTFVYACQAPDDKGLFFSYPSKHELLAQKLSALIPAADLLSDLFTDLSMKPKPRDEEDNDTDTASDDGGSHGDREDDSEEESDDDYED